MGASFAKMEAPLDGSADDGSSLLPPAARAGMTVRIKRKERVRELDFFDHLISSEIIIHSLFVFMCVSFSASF